MVYSLLQHDRLWRISPLGRVGIQQQSEYSRLQKDGHIFEGFENNKTSQKEGNLLSPH